MSRVFMYMKSEIALVTPGSLLTFTSLLTHHNLARWQAHTKLSSLWY